MNEHFTINQFEEIPKNAKIYFRKYFWKNNVHVGIDTVICSIRIGDYNSPFGHRLIPIKTPIAGYLMHTKRLDDKILESDTLFRIFPKEQSEITLNTQDKFDHFFSGNGSVYTFLRWLKPNNSYVRINDPIYAFSFVNEPFMIHYAERTGKLKFSELKVNFIFENNLLYTIEHSEPFEQESEFVQNLTAECYVYLMHDLQNDFYKIGISTDPIYREKTLQSEKPTIELIIAKRFPIRIIANSFEKALHKSFEHKRIRGEWFNLDANDVENIVRSLK